MVRIQPGIRTTTLSSGMMPRDPVNFAALMLEPYAKYQRFSGFDAMVIAVCIFLGLVAILSMRRQFEK
jgi:hypothetical protein